jgi:hypothetical protein
VHSRPEAPTLAELQRRFASALRAGGVAAEDAVVGLAGCIVDDGLAPARRVQVYRNNARAMFEGALERTYPVLRRQVGEDAFRDYAREYRGAHPSRSGDLHWVGREFASWLATRVAGGSSAWLADLARLEWACEESLVSARRAALDVGELGRLAPELLADIGLELQPCLRTVASAFPIWSVWRNGQTDSIADPLDPGSGSQHVVVACGEDGLVLHSVPEDQFRFVTALSDGASLGMALESAGLDIERLPGVLAWLFGDGLVTALRMPASDDSSHGETV